MQDQYVTIQTNDDASLNNFVTELRNMNITDSLNNNVNANPSKNYDTFIKLLQDAKDYLYGKLSLININIRRINGLQGVF